MNVLRLTMSKATSERWRLYLARLADPKRFQKAQRRAMSQTMNGVQKVYRQGWQTAVYKRAKPKNSHRAAIKRSIRTRVFDTKKAVTVGVTGLRRKQYPKSAIANVIDPGFRHVRSGKLIPGKLVRARAQKYAETRGLIEFRDNLRAGLLEIANRAAVGATK